MSDNIIEQLDLLDAEDMARVERLINKLASHKHQDRKTKKSSKPIDFVPAEPKIKHGTQKRIGRKRKADSIPQVRRKNKGRAARREPINIDIERENKFLTTTDAEISKARAKNTDRKIDILLAGDNEPVTRRTQPGLVEIECAGDCGYIYVVSPSLIYNDPEKGPIFTCNDCASAKGN